MNQLKPCMMLSSRARIPVQKFTAYTVRRASQLNDKEQVIKRFKPSFESGGSAEVVSETIERPAVNVMQRVRHKKKLEKEEQLKSRKLNWIDKKILVRLGKYKSVEEVPDEVVYKSKVDGQKAKNEVRSFLNEKGFRAFVFTDYIMTVCCAGLFCFVLYLTSNASKPSEIKQNPKE